MLAIRDKNREPRPLRLFSAKHTFVDETVNKMIYNVVFSEPSDDLGHFVRDCFIEHLCPEGDVEDYLGDGAFWPYEPDNELHDERLPDSYVDNSHNPNTLKTKESRYTFDTTKESVDGLVLDAAREARTGGISPMSARKINRNTSAYTGRFTSEEEDSANSLLFDVRLYNASKSGRSHNGYSFLS